MEDNSGHWTSDPDLTLHADFPLRTVPQAKTPGVVAGDHAGYVSPEGSGSLHALKPQIPRPYSDGPEK